ncbi:LuxR C-terminal-related transcriptional regulator [uncultured Draconibacterium sp.]|uniref:LuxR C-terminal-related transcriptional regulator n=1 Tax=uncultured Draconibacterium sp. TaxID=1573823 RepID=UPI0032602482
MNRQKLILLNMPEDEDFKKLYTILKANNYRVERTNSAQSLLQKILELIPDLIICANYTKELEGFQTLNLLKKTSLQSVVPYIIFLKEHDYDNLLLGIELGADSFIFSPLNEKRILQRIKTLFEKVDKQKNAEKRRFENLFNTSITPMLVCEFNTIVRINPAFSHMSDYYSGDNLPSLLDIFDFKELPNSEKVTQMYLKGLLNDYVLKDVKLLGNKNIVVNLHLTKLDNIAHNQTLMQVEVINKQKNDIMISFNSENDTKSNGKNEKAIDLTSREHDIIKMSGQGMPIKLIAAELNISQRTVEKHRSNIMRKTNTSNIIEALTKVYSRSNPL